MHDLPVRPIPHAFRKVINHYSHIALKHFPYLFRQMTHLIYMKMQIVNILPRFCRDIWLNPLFPEELMKLPTAPPSGGSPVKYEFDNRIDILCFPRVLLSICPACVARFPKQHLSVRPGLIGDQIHEPDMSIRHLILAYIFELIPDLSFYLFCLIRQCLIDRFCRACPEVFRPCELSALIQKYIDRVRRDIRKSDKFFLHDILFFSCHLHDLSSCPQESGHAT